MTWEAWLTLATVGLVFVALLRNWAGPDLIMLGGLTLLITAGLFSEGKLPSPNQAVASFGNEALITVAVLLVVAAGLGATGAMDLVTRPLLGRPQHLWDAQTRLMLPVVGLSAFLNNTPVVAMFMPVVSDWSRKTGLAASKLFIPLSYAAVLGGVCTLIGTSTNLVVFGMVRRAQADGALPGVEIGMFSLAWVGVPVTVAGVLYILLVSKWLLPDRRSHLPSAGEARSYTVEMLVERGSAVDGKTIEQAGLRHLPGLFLAEIERQGERLVAVGPEQVLRGQDRLIFVGVLDSVVDLQKIRGLTPAAGQVFKLSDPRPNRRLVEAVVSHNCPLVGKTIREGRFRTMYDAVVIAVHRGGQHLANQKIGDIVLRGGDVLLLETHPRFVDAQRNRGDFYLVSTVEGSAPPRHDRAWIALLILAAMVFAVTIGWLSMLNAAMLAAGLMILTRCCSGTEARAAIDWSTLLVIGGALGLAQAIETSGLARHFASNIIAMASGNPWLVLLAVYFVTMLITELITNNAAAAMVFPIAISAAGSLGVNPMPFIVTVMVAASCAFATPIGYQTNLMVYGPGGYRFSDYLRIGVPLNLLCMTLTLTLAPRVWPF